MAWLASIRTPALRERLIHEMPDAALGWLPEAFATPRQAVIAIADAQASLLIIEMEQPLPWLALVRSDPATRRVPLVALISTAEGEDRARQLHAEAVINVTQHTAGLSDLLTPYARPAVDQGRLADECAAPLPALVLQGLHEFNTGAYYECHETLEAAWLATTGPVRDVYRAILQIAVAYYQIERGNYRGAHKMFVRAVQWFAPLPERCHGIDLAQLRADAAASRTHLEALGPDHIRDFDLTLLKPIQLHS